MKPVTLKLGAGSSTTIVGSGDVWLNVKSNAGYKKCLIRDVKYAPNLGYKIISVPEATKRNLKVVFEESSASIYSKNNGSLMVKGILRNGLYRLEYTHHTRVLSKSPKHKGSFHHFGNVDQKFIHSSRLMTLDQGVESKAAKSSAPVFSHKPTRRSYRDALVKSYVKQKSLFSKMGRTFRA
jgi:hypothetical protein